MLPRMSDLPDSVKAAARRGPLYVVLNAGSGHNDTDEQQAIMSRVFKGAGREVEFFQITDPSRISETATRAVTRAKATGGVIVAAGGDGTINAVAGAALGSGCPFGVLPQGTFNYFGRAHAIPQDTEAAATALLGASVSPAQAGLLNGHVFLVNASLGLYPQLLQDRETWKKKLGRSRLVAFVSGLVTVIRADHQLELQVELAGQHRLIRTPTLFVGNNPLQLSRVGMDASLVDAVGQEGRLAAIAIRKMSTWSMLGLLWRGLIGKMGDDANVESFAFRRVTIATRRARRIKVALDGEVQWMQSPLVFEVAATPLLLMVPAPADRVEIA